MINLLEAILIVLVVLAIAMGWRMGLIIGWALIVTILGTFIVMKMMHIDLQRVSLGALVVALGMMVDNAIVVADNYSVRLAKGMKPLKAAIESAAGPSIALLGATVVAAMAFYLCMPLMRMQVSTDAHCLLWSVCLCLSVGLFP